MSKVRNGTRQEERPADSACRGPLLTRPGNKIIVVRAAAKILTLQSRLPCEDSAINTTHTISRGPTRTISSPRIEAYRDPLTASSTGLDLVGKSQSSVITRGSREVIRDLAHGLFTPHSAKWQVDVK